MKGKGKTSHIDKECPLAFPDLQPVDHTKDCLKYSRILDRTEDECLTLDELDTVQTDLETLLASAGKRLKLLESEIQILVNWQDKKDSTGNKKGTPVGKDHQQNSGKRGKGATDDKPSKKLKDVNGKASHVVATPPAKPKNKSAVSKLQEYEFSDSPRETLPKLPKNDAVNRFWQSVEPYCADITNDDLKLLEDTLKSHEEDSDYFKVTPLGKHYTEKWAEEDLMEEQTDGVKVDKKRNSGSHNNNHIHHDSTTLLKKLEPNNMEDSPFGQLTQRLVSALIEENIMTPIDDSMNDITGGKESADEAPAISPRTLAKQLNIGNPVHLERRIKRELEEQGILDFEDKEDDNPDDEILAEIRKKQSELRLLCQRNIIITRQLYCKAKEQMARQEMKKKLAAADAEVMEAYRKIQTAKQKKKTPTKKEKDAAFKALKERASIMKALEV
ncbi:transcriptional adapter 3-B [Patella vulgata]|uniref:transcriptional adapter 3-B n=1 Tax=Patella vulgata TaxID=6465 RepID=UPI00218077B1|nr:transcriptional adapter 3-B [Patella vulgata]